MMATARQKAKFRSFVRRIRELLPNLPIDVETVAVGILERLWHTTATDALRGDIGKLSDDEIAESVGWHGEAKQIVETLIETKWIDRCEKYRLVIHHWHDHAPSYVKGNASKVGGFVTESPIGPAPQDPPIGPSPEDGRSYPIVSLPNQSLPNQSNSIETKPEKKSSYDSLFLEFWESFASGRKSKKKAAAQAFKKAVDAGTEPSVIIEASKEYAASYVATTEFVLGPVPWLNQGCWEDDRSAWGNPKSIKLNMDEYEDRPEHRPFPQSRARRTTNGTATEVELPEVSIEEFVTQWNSVLKRSDSASDELKPVMQEKLKEQWWRRFWYEAIDEIFVREKAIELGRVTDELPKHMELAWVFSVPMEKCLPKLEEKYSGKTMQTKSEKKLWRAW